MKVNSFREIVEGSPIAKDHLCHSNLWRINSKHISVLLPKRFEQFSHESLLRGFDQRSRQNIPALLDTLSLMAFEASDYDFLTVLQVGVMLIRSIILVSEY